MHTPSPPHINKQFDSPTKSPNSSPTLTSRAKPTMDSDSLHVYNLCAQSSISPTLICTPVHRRRNTEYKVLTPKTLNILASPSYRPQSCLTQPRIRPISRMSSFATLAPLSSSRSAPRTPIDHERSLKRSADSMTRLLISDDTENTNSSDSDSQSCHPKRRKDARVQGRASRRQKLLRSPQQSHNLSPTPLPSSPCPTNGQSLTFKPSIISLGSPLAGKRGLHLRNDSHSSTSSTESQSETLPCPPPSSFPSRHIWQSPDTSHYSDSDEEVAYGRSLIPFASDTRYQDVKTMPVLELEDSSFLTPGLTFSPSSVWPTGSSAETETRVENVDSFILKTLKANPAGNIASTQEKRMPHTPVKRQPFLSQSTRRPWMSVSRINTSVTLPSAGEGGLFGKARKSMPNTLPSFSSFATPFRRPPAKHSPTYRESSPAATQSPSTPLYKPQLLQRFDSGSSFASDVSSLGTPTRPRSSSKCE